MTLEKPTSEGADQLFLLRFSGELSTKSEGTRRRFVQRLQKNLADALGSAGFDHEVKLGRNRLFLRAAPEAQEVARRIFGVQSISPVSERSWSAVEDLERHGEELFTAAVRGKTFAVRVRRAGTFRSIPVRTVALERQLGSRLIGGSAGVDLSDPQVTAGIEVHRSSAYYYDRIVPGEGGFPLGVEGRSLALVSGGFDSAVASWMMLRRGVALDYLFCNLGGDTHRDGVLGVLKVLVDRWSAGTRPRLQMVDFQPVVEEIQEKTPPSLWQILLKRQMLRAADALVRILGLSSMVTGEAIGQVSSQTLPNLTVTSEATEIPILRPLLTASKEEIVAQAHRIGTGELSAKIPEYCGLGTRRPSSHASLPRVEEAEVACDEALLPRLIDERAQFQLRLLDLDKIRAPNRELSAIPEGAKVVDLRSAPAFESWHVPGAEWMSYRDALHGAERLEHGKTYVFYCEVGLKSAHVAEVLHRAGHRAFHLKGGFRPLFEAYQDPLLRAATFPVFLD